MNLGNAENIILNKNILSVMGYEGVGKDGLIDVHVFGDNLCVWKDNLQSAIADEIADWEVEKGKVCSEFGWTIDRLRKNPMVLEATLENIVKKQKVPILEKLCATIWDKFKKPALA